MNGLWGILKVFFASPNGQLRIIGAAMVLGPAYYSYTTGLPIEEFDYYLLGIGSLFILISVVMAVIKARIDVKK